MLAVLRAAEGYFEERGVDAPRYSAELLLGSVLGLPRLKLYLAHDRPVTEPERAALRPLVAQRGKGTPLAYVLGAWDFRGHELEVTRDVLVPRPETEALVDLALERAPQGARCADLGTGSGAIGLALALERPDVSVWASDVSPAAAAIARRNVDRHAVGDRVTVVEGADWQPLLPGAPYDLVISNPPYVDPDRDDLLQPEVRRFEPHVALFAAPGDPASAYRAIVAGVDRGLAEGGWLVMETGVEAADAALEVLRESSALTDSALLPDLAGLPRYLIARRA